jgi:glycosyltransferase involved in cell wall biosynthesis
MNHQSQITNHQSPILSVVLATRNEEANIGACLNSVKKIADEIVVVDEKSTDKTRDVAESFGARVYEAKHEKNFHITKQKALNYATGDWILQLDADEIVTPELAREIKYILTLEDDGIDDYEKQQKQKHPRKTKLFQRHQALNEKHDGYVGEPSDEIVAFFIPRKNYFMGKPLIHAGVYPDGVIRLIKRGKASFPAKSVHELMEIDGRVAWLFNDLEHHDSPSLKRYIERANRYTDLAAGELKQKHVPLNVVYLLNYSLVKPLVVFLKLYIRHRGYKDGMRGFIW